MLIVMGINIYKNTYLANFRKQTNVQKRMKSFTILQQPIGNDLKILVVSSHKITTTNDNKYNITLENIDRKHMFVPKCLRFQTIRLKYKAVYAPGYRVG